MGDASGFDVYGMDCWIRKEEPLGLELGIPTPWETPQMLVHIGHLDQHQKVARNCVWISEILDNGRGETWLQIMRIDDIPKNDIVVWATKKKSLWHTL